MNQNHTTDGESDPDKYSQVGPHSLNKSRVLFVDQLGRNLLAKNIIGVNRHVHGHEVQQVQDCNDPNRSVKKKSDGFLSGSGTRRDSHPHEFFSTV